MGKYKDQISIENDLIVVGNVTLDSYEDIQELEQDIRNAMHRRGVQRSIARQEKINNPATYGLDKAFFVTIGKADTKWRIDRIHQSDYSKTYSVAADLTRYHHLHGYQHLSVDVERLVQTDVPVS